MLTIFLYLSALLHEKESEAERIDDLGTWHWTVKQEISGGAVPGTDPRPGTEPDPEPEPDPDPEPLPPPAPNPGPDPGFPIDPYPRPLPIRVTTLSQGKLDKGY